MNHRAKLLVFLLCALAILFGLHMGYSALNTMSRLNVVESERDKWQRPLDVIRTLDLRPGNVVVDLGCGSGYFTLKLSSSVGASGNVIAEDIRRLPLVFLWFRTALKRNVTIIHGKPDDPHLPTRVDAVLVANTYHEFTDAQAILAHVSHSVIEGGRLVVVDRAPHSDSAGVTESPIHEISAERVENALRDAHFDILSRQNHFIENDPDGETWWLIVARKP